MDLGPDRLSLATTMPLPTFAAFLAFAVAAPGQDLARNGSSPREIRVPDRPTRAHLWNQVDGEGVEHTYASISLDGVHFQPPRRVESELELRYARFDPRESVPVVPRVLRAGPSNRLFVVQYWTQGLEEYRAVLGELGVQVRLFLANNANVVELEPGRIAAVEALDFVRSVTPFHPAFKLEEELLAAVLEGTTGPVRINVLTTAKGQDEVLIPWIEAHDGSISERCTEARLLTVDLAYELLPELASLDHVQWIDRGGPRVPIMDVAREFHGANHVEAAHGLTGSGVNVEVLDFGCDTRHPDLQDYLLHGQNSRDPHGTCTSGIVAGDGLARPRARGVVPGARLVLADLDFGFDGGDRFTHTSRILQAPFRCVVQSNSWVTTPLTSAYNAQASQLDSILFDLERVSIVQGMGNTGTSVCGRESWAKNLITIGGIDHQNTLTDTDDGISGASIGFAADGRIKPDLASFYDRILCTDELGNSGYVNGDYYESFSGTSAATPIVAGHLALIYEMWHRGMFGNPHPGATPFENAPFNTTAKALLVNSAKQWSNLIRRAQGWGHPDLAQLSLGLARMLVVDETDVLTNLQSRSYTLEVLPGESSLHATLVYRDPAGTTASTLHRINDLDLTVVSPGNLVYHGNNGLTSGSVSTPGGTSDTKNTVENVLVDQPQSGSWTVIVTAAELNEDNHVETTALDADYALVVRGAKEIPVVLPQAPDRLRGRAVAHKARLSFRDNASNEDGYELERSLDGVTFQPVAILAPYENEPQDSGLLPDQDYYYRVRAFNSLGTSAWSNVIHVRTNKAARR